MLRTATRRDQIRAVDRQRHAQRVLHSHVITLPAPVGGLNGRDALDDMETADAVVLTNWYPGFGKCEVRGGSALWAEIQTEESALFSDGWTGDDDDPWDAAKWDNIETIGTASATIQGNRGYIAMSNATTNWLVRMEAASLTVDDFDLVFSIQLSATGPQFHSVSFRADQWAVAVGGPGSRDNPLNGYRLSINGQENVLRLARCDAGVRTTLGSTAPKTWGTGLWQVRLRAEGQSLKARAWQGAEPGSWDLEREDATHTSGKLMLAFINSENVQHDVSLDNFRVIELPEVAGAIAAVETVATLQAASFTRMIAACGTSIYAVSDGGTVFDSLGDGFGNARWQHATMNDVMGLVNGEDAPQTYDGSTLEAMTIDAADGEPSLDVTEFIGINVYRNRSYFIRTNDAGFWFSAVNTLGGDLEYFPLGDVQGVGGNLVAMVSWTRDGGDGGAEDLAVFLMSSGQAVLYQGSDPSEANDWSLVGVFAMGRPIGRRCVVKIGGEAIVLTEDGYTQLSRVLPGGRTAKDVNVSDKLGRIALDQIRASSAEFGWQPIHYPRRKALLVNYPIGGDAYQQHAGNLATGAWCKFDGWQARCFALMGDRLFFGADDGQVIEADVGPNDLGADIVALGQQAFSTFRGPIRNKHVQMVRPLLEATGEAAIAVSMYSDYSPLPDATVEVTFGVGAPGADWDDADWDTADWAGPSKTVQGWIGHASRGYAISPAIRVAQRADQIAWSGMTIAYTVDGLT